MNLGDPELELIDPTPNVHTLFIHFDKLFFWTTLSSRAVVRWSKRMYSCAGICSYEGRGGLCDIALSEPLLKLRSRKDLVETLLHEMIHAYLFITSRDRDRDGHGPNFQAHMHRINKFAGLNISIYHDFHDEVRLYQTHWWRCNGPCQKQRPYFGIVRRSSNRAPGPSDCWFAKHKASCGGTFIKIKEPENHVKRKAVSKSNNPPITKYINNNNNSILNKNIPVELPSKNPVLKESNKVPAKTSTKPKSTGAITVIATKKDNIVFNPKPVSTQPLNGTGHTTNGARSRTNSASAAETVRNIWANKQLPSTPPSTTVKRSTNVTNTNKQVRDPSPHLGSPPSKIKKIDDYFKTKATSILKDVYGQDFQITKPQNSKKLVAVSVKKLVSCPVCNVKVQDDLINRHLDECLNKDVIEKLSKDNIQPIQYTDQSTQGYHRTQPTKNKSPQVPKCKGIEDISQFKIENKDIKLEIPDSISLSFMDELLNDKPGKSKEAGTAIKTESKSIPIVNLQADSNKDLIKSDKKETALIKVEKNYTRPMKLCLCCNRMTDKPLMEHLEECLQFFKNDSTKPEAGASTSFANDAIVIDDDEDIFDESMTLNATGTKTPCPCCLAMVEQNDMNEHLDMCLK